MTLNLYIKTKKRKNKIIKKKRKNMKNIIIAGASGYIGNRFLALISKDIEYNIIALCINKNEFDNIKVAEHVKIMTNEEFFNSTEVLENACLVNFAFPRKSDISVLLDVFDYMYKLYNKAFKLGVKKIINTSSQSVYDFNRSKPAVETDLLRPFDIYGLGKIYTEYYTEMFSKRNKINYINIRLGAVSGPNFDQRIINKIIYQFINNQNINLEEKGELFSYINVNDVAQFYTHIIKTNNLNWNTIYNLGVEEFYTITDILKTVEQELGNLYKGVISIKKAKENLRTNRLDCSKLYKVIDYRPQYNLELTIKEIIENINLKEQGNEI